MLQLFHNRAYCLKKSILINHKYIRSKVYRIRYSQVCITDILNSSFAFIFLVIFLLKKVRLHGNFLTKPHAVHERGLCQKKDENYKHLFLECGWGEGMWDKQCTLLEISYII